MCTIAPFKHRPLSTMQSEQLSGHLYSWITSGIGSAYGQHESCPFSSASNTGDGCMNDIFIGVVCSDLISFLNRSAPKTLHFSRHFQIRESLSTQDRPSSFVHASGSSQTQHYQPAEDNASVPHDASEEKPATRPISWICHLCHNIQGLQTPACTGVTASGNICGHQKCDNCTTQ